MFSVQIQILYTIKLLIFILTIFKTIFLNFDGGHGLKNNIKTNNNAILPIKRNYIKTDLQIIIFITLYDYISECRCSVYFLNSISTSAEIPLKKEDL
jgi:hypothetical protein